MPLASLDEIRSRAGSEVGTSSWLTVGQDRIEAFAEATEDRQFIHTHFWFCYRLEPRRSHPGNTADTVR